MKTVRSTPISVSKTFKVLAISFLAVLGASMALPIFMAKTMTLAERALWFLPVAGVFWLCAWLARLGTRSAPSSPTVARKAGARAFTEAPAPAAPLAKHAAAAQASHRVLSASAAHYKRLGHIALAVFLGSLSLLVVCTIEYVHGHHALDVPIFLLGAVALVSGLSAVAPYTMLRPRAYDESDSSVGSGYYSTPGGGPTLSPLASAEHGFPIEM